MNVFKGDLPPGIALKLRKKDSSFRYSEDYNRMHGSCHGLSENCTKMPLCWGHYDMMI